MNAAISGEVDLANITSDTQAQVESAGIGLVANGGTVAEPRRRSTRTAASAPQWADPRVCQALSMAIDRETYVNAVHPGEIPTANALPADNPGYLPELDEEYAYDPEGAKDAAGRGRLPRRIRLRLHDQPGQPARPRGAAAVLGGDRRRREPQERRVDRGAVRRRADRAARRPDPAHVDQPARQRLRRAVRLRELPRRRERRDPGALPVRYGAAQAATRPRRRRRSRT